MNAMTRAMLIVIGALVGCAAAKSAPAMRAPALPPAPPPTAAAPAPAAASPGGKATATTTHTNARFSTTGSATATATTELLPPAIIYTGMLAMLVDEDQLAAALDRAIDLAEAVGGFQSSRKDTSVELRVPAPKFRHVLKQLEGLGEVTSRSVNAQDVSEEIHDAEVRIENLEATQKRLLELLAKARNIPETLTIERELERVTLELDRLEGRLRFLRTRASYSTIIVNVAARPRIVKTVASGPAPRRIPVVVLPIGWLDELGAPRLLTLK